MVEPTAAPNAIRLIACVMLFGTLISSLLHPTEQTPSSDPPRSKDNLHAKSESRAGTQSQTPGFHCPQMSDPEAN